MCLSVCVCLYLLPPLTVQLIICMPSNFPFPNNTGLCVWHPFCVQLEVDRQIDRRETYLGSGQYSRSFFFQAIKFVQSFVSFCCCRCRCCCSFLLCFAAVFMLLMQGTGKFSLSLSLFLAFLLFNRCHHYYYKASCTYSTEKEEK